MVPSVSLGCNAGKFWKPWRQLPGPEPFMICLSVFICSVNVGSAGLSRKMGSLGNEGHWPETLRLIFWDAAPRMSLAVRFQLPLLFYFHSEPGNPARTQPSNLGPNLQKFCSHRLVCPGCCCWFFLDFLSGCPHGSKSNSVSLATTCPSPVSS